METSLIFKSQRIKYELFKWVTFGWVIWFGTFLIWDVIDNFVLLSLLILIGCVNVVLCAVNAFTLGKMWAKVNSDERLKKVVLGNYQTEKVYKSCYWGFLITTCFLGFFLLMALFTNVDALTVVKTTLFFGIFSVLVAWLIYNYDG
ncbi:hypothetical protein QLX67_11455 [Balneolaceae bacterium ANBcel3]|nr:hypothetical protein [Balneolaceae bacterium ANBcel3]